VFDLDLAICSSWRVFRICSSSRYTATAHSRRIDISKFLCVYIHARIVELTLLLKRVTPGSNICTISSAVIIGPGTYSDGCGDLLCDLDGLGPEDY